MLALAGLLFVANHASAETVGPIEVSVVPSASMTGGAGTSHGYVEFRVNLKN